VDVFITPHNSVRDYERQVAQLGQDAVDELIRFYMIPGLGHGFGPFNAKFDSLTALRRMRGRGNDANPASSGACAGRGGSSSYAAGRRNSCCAARADDFVAQLRRRARAGRSCSVPHAARRGNRGRRRTERDGPLNASIEPGPGAGVAPGYCSS